MKTFLCSVLSLLILQLQMSGITACANGLSPGAPSGVIVSPLQGGVELVTKKGARIVRKVRRVRYYRRGSGTRTVRRYHFVRHSRSVDTNRTRVGNKVLTKPSSAPKQAHPPSIELPRDIVAPLIIHGVDNLQAGKRYIEVVERDGKLFIKEGGDIDPNGQFLEVEEEDGVWKIKGTDIVVDFSNTFDVSKVPPAVRKFINPATDKIAPGENYVQYEEQAGRETIPIQEDTIPPLVNPGDYAEIYQVPVGGEQAPGNWETIDVPVGPVKGGALAPVEGTPVGAVPVGTAGPVYETVGGIPVSGVGVPGDPVVGVPGIGVPGVPVTTGIGVGGPPVTTVPVGGIGVPGAPMSAAAPAPPPAASPAPPPVAAPAPPVAALPAESPPAPAIPAAGFPMVDKPGNIVPFTPVGSVPPPSVGRGGFPLGGIIPAALGAAALGGLIIPMALMGGGGGSGYGGGYYPVPVGGGTPGVTPPPQVSPPVIPPTTPPCPPPPCPPPPCPPPPCPPPPCPPPPCPPPPCPPPPCPPPPCPPPPCPPPPPGCYLPPPCLPPCLPPPCPPIDCGPPIYGGCDTGYGYGNGCDSGYGSGYGNGCESGWGSGNPCMGNANKFGCNPPDGTATSYKERWWSQAGRSYAYNGPCAANQSGCSSSMGGGGACGAECTPSRSSAMSCPPAPY